MPDTVVETAPASEPQRRRRSAADMQEIRDAIVRLLDEEHPMTVRQCFYRLTVMRAVEKTEQAYKGVVVRLLTEMRRSGELSFNKIADHTRWMRKPRTHDSLQDMLESSARTYRRSVWQDEQSYVEVWLEKDALAGVLYEETEKWDVPLMTTRGYPSLSFLHQAAETIEYRGVPAHLYYLGDHDPSGLDITRAVEAGIRELAPHADIRFTRVAVTREQIEEYDLPSRPTKTTDSRSAGFDGESTEVDALPPTKLRSIVRECIERHIGSGTLERIKRTEQLERQTLSEIAENLKAGRT